MKVLHLVTYDIGGAYIAAKRISDALNKTNQVESTILILESKTKDTKDAVCLNDAQLFINKVKRKIVETYILPDSTNNYQISYGIVGNSIEKNALIMDADIIHLHWISRGFLSAGNINTLCKAKKKIVWTMHDMWPFTGVCHYSLDCNKYEGQCIKCPAVNSKHKLIEELQNHKCEYTNKDNIAFVGCSNWIVECAKRSKVLMDCHRIHVVPNPMAHDFYLCDKEKRRTMRKKYGFREEDIILMFGAMEIDDYRKGGHFIKDIFQMALNSGYKLLLFGSNYLKGMSENTSITCVGNCNLTKMNELYNVADVFLALSIQENLANTVMESLSCGTPVVAFNIGGMPDMIINTFNGYLAKPFSTEDVLNGVEFCQRTLKYKQKEISEDIKKRFSDKLVAQKYISVYKSLRN